MQKHIFLTELLVILLFTNVYSQKTIVGVVNNKNSVPFANVKVYSNDNQEGVFTDINGEYIIIVSNDCKALVFTYDGLSFEEVINGRTVVNKIMSKNAGKIKRTDYRFNVMLNAGGTIVWGAVSGSVMLSQYMSIDLGLGLGKAYIGSSFYINSPFKNKNWQPYVGINIAYFEEFMGPTSTLVYIPAGLRFLNYKGTSFSFEIAGLMSNNARFLLKTPIWGGIKFGKYF